jgi:hypothetical protein
LPTLTLLQEAVSLYARSRCYNHAMRLAKTHGMDTELMSFAVQSRPSLMVDVAQYFEVPLSLHVFEPSVCAYVMSCIMQRSDNGKNLTSGLSLCSASHRQRNNAVIVIAG